MYIFLTTKPNLKVILQINWLIFPLAISKEEIHKTSVDWSMFV